MEISHYSYRIIIFFLIIILFLLKICSLCQHYTRCSDRGIMPKIRYLTLSQDIRIYGIFFYGISLLACRFSCDCYTRMSRSGTIIVFFCYRGNECNRKQPSYMRSPSYFAAIIQTLHCYYSKVHVRRGFSPTS